MSGTKQEWQILQNKILDHMLDNQFKGFNREKVEKFLMSWSFREITIYVHNNL